MYFDFYKKKYLKYMQKMHNFDNIKLGGRMLKEHLSQPFFDNIKSGRKKYEGRLNKPGKFQINDVVVWYNDDNGLYQEFTTKITNMQYFPTFKLAIDSVGLENILPSEYDIGSSIDQAIINVYRRWYSEEKEAELGIVLLEFEFIE